MTRPTYIRFFAYISLTMFFATLLLTYKILTNFSEPCQCPENTSKCKENHLDHLETLKHPSIHSDSQHKLALLVPYRDRFEELMEFVPYITRWLRTQRVNHHIFILNQADQLRFNRGALINVGYNEIRKHFDYIVMHDVDLLPGHPDIKYTYPSEPTHLASPEYHPKYKYPKFIGGIFAINNQQFEDVNGLSNKYWGWGLEDDEFYVRIVSKGYNIRRFTISNENKNILRHIHGKHRKRDTQKCYNQREVTRKRDRDTGFRDVQYKILNYKKMSIEDANFTVINVELQCNRTVTPWCDCTAEKKA